MGSAVAHRLSEHGIHVLTSLRGRGPQTLRRAATAKMQDADEDTIAQADVILPILPPAEALALAERFAAPLSRVQRKAIFVDCNAVNVETVLRISSIINATSPPAARSASSETKRSGRGELRQSMSPTAASGLRVANSGSCDSARHRVCMTTGGLDMRAQADDFSVEIGGPNWFLPSRRPRPSPVEALRDRVEHQQQHPVEIKH
jgi:hypothetical protein